MNRIPRIGVASAIGAASHAPAMSANPVAVSATGPHPCTAASRIPASGGGIIITSRSVITWLDVAMIARTGDDHGVSMVARRLRRSISISARMMRNWLRSSRNYSVRSAWHAARSTTCRLSRTTGRGAAARAPSLRAGAIAARGVSGRPRASGPLPEQANKKNRTKKPNAITARRCMQTGLAGSAGRSGKATEATIEQPFGERI